MRGQDIQKTLTRQANDVPASVMRQIEHELRTPLHGILGMLGLLLDGHLPPASMIQAEAAKDSAESLIAVLNDLVDYTAILERRLALDSRNFHPVEMIERVAELHAGEAARKGLEIAWFVDPLIPHTLQGDPDRVRQIFHALCSNAVRYTEKGAISLSLSFQEERDGRLYLMGNVSDTGPGIPETYRDVLGVSPIEHDGGYGRTSSGTGLGLFLASRLIEQMGGKLHIESSSEHGTSLSFSLCLEKVPEKKPAGTFPCFDVVLIEPSRLIRETMARQLRADGHRVSAWDSVYDASHCLKQNDPVDVICIADSGQGGQLIALHALLPSSADKVPIVRLVPFGVHTHEPLLVHDRKLAVVHKPVRRMALRQALASLCGHETETAFAGRRSAGSSASIFVHERTGQVEDSSGAKAEIRENSQIVDSSHRVLVVDDSPTNLMIASTTLRKAGYQVDTAESGRDAIDLLMNKSDYGLVLMDISMPVMDGITATRLIRELGGRMAQIPVIAYSANIQDEDRQTCRDAGMTDFLPKPAKRGLMLAKVEEYLTCQPKSGSDVFDPMTAARWRSSAGDDMFQMAVAKLHQELHNLFEVSSEDSTSNNEVRRHDLAISCDQAGLLRLAEVLRSDVVFDWRSDPSIASLLDESMSQLEVLRSDMLKMATNLENSNRLH